MYPPDRYPLGLKSTEQEQKPRNYEECFQTYPVSSRVKSAEYVVLRQPKCRHSHDYESHSSSYIYLPVGTCQTKGRKLDNRKQSIPSRDCGPGYVTMQLFPKSQGSQHGTAQVRGPVNEAHHSKVSALKSQQLIESVSNESHPILQRECEYQNRDEYFQWW